MLGISLPVLRGSVWSFGGQTVALLASLIATPVVIRLLGVDAYGVLTLITVLIGYAGASDLGMGEASTRFSAVRHTAGDADGEARVVWTALLVLTVPTALVAVTLILAAGPIIDALVTLPDWLRLQAVLALRIAAVGFLARVLATVANTPHLVRLRLDVVAVINATASVAQIVLVPVLLWFGGGLVAAAAVGTISATAALVAHAIAARRFLPALTRPRLEVEIITPLLRYGGATMVIVLAGLVAFNGEKLVIAKVLSATALAYYGVAFTLARLLALVPGAIAQSIFPAFARLQGDADRDALHALYDRALRVLVVLGVPSAAILCLLARPFLTAWAGPDFGRESLAPMYILTIGSLIDGLSYIPRAALNAKNRPDLAARLHLIDLAPYLVAAFLLTRAYGVSGAAAAWALRATSDCVVMLILARRSAGAISFMPALLRVIPAAAMLAVSVAVLLIFQPSPFVVIPVAAIALAAYAGLVWTRVLTREERSMADTWLQTRGGHHSLGAPRA